MSISKDRILYQDDHLLMVNKLSGELVVKGKGKVQKLPLLDFLKKEILGLRTLNRLDFETSGIVIFAKSKEAYEKSLVQMKDWKKVYKALVKGKPRRTGVITKKLAARNTKGDVDAVTRYNVEEQFAPCALVECEIETGRQHQIRKHFASIHHPLVLDDVYGDEKYNKAFSKHFRYRKFFLHAARVELKHPVTGEKIIVEAELPKAFREVLQSL